MAYVFSALNSLQGCFIFVFHCVQNEKVSESNLTVSRGQSSPRRHLHRLKYASNAVGVILLYQLVLL